MQLEFNWRERITNLLFLLSRPVLLMGASDNNTRGLVLAMLSSFFIGASFILKKMGLKRAAAASGTSAGMGYTFPFLLFDPILNVPYQIRP